LHNRINQWTNIWRKHWRDVQLHIFTTFLPFYLNQVFDCGNNRILVFFHEFIHKLPCPWCIRLVTEFFN
jgi:hypothetical protein